MEKIFLKDKGLFVLKYRSIRSWGRATVKIIWKGTFPGPFFHPKYKATPHRTCKLSNLWSVLTKAQEQQTEVAQLFPPFIGVSSPNSCLWPSCMDFTAPCTSPSEDTPPHSFKLTLDHYLLPSQPPSHSSSITQLFHITVRSYLSPWGPHTLSTTSQCLWATLKPFHFLLVVLFGKTTQMNELLLYLFFC